VDRPLRFGLGLGAVLLVGVLVEGASRTGVLHRERTFFGVMVVEKRGEYHRLIQGSTLQGAQAMSEDRRGEAITYFHRSSPIGEVFTALDRREAAPVAVLGMGAGTLASYGRARQEFVFFEIDPALIRVAWNPDYFTYLEDAERRGVRLDVVPGDGRLQLGKKADDHFGLIVVDALNSDALPPHLFTREAVALYLRKLAPGGVIAFHVSNRYLSLAPVLAT
jgi:predicted membrane-bound spermidine synthase